MKILQVKKILGRLMRKMGKMGRKKRAKHTSMYDRKRNVKALQSFFDALGRSTSLTILDIDDVEILKPAKRRMSLD